MNIRTILVFFGLLFMVLSTYGQRRGVKYGSSGYSESVNNVKDPYTRLVDDVFFDIKEKNTRITGDSALYFEQKGVMYVYGDVVIKEGDSVTITAKQLNYFMKDKKAELRNDVVYYDYKIRLTTDYLDYFTDTEDVQYYEGGKIVDDSTTLISESAYVVNAENLIKFYKNVDLKSPQYHLKTDTLFYNQVSKIATTYGPTQTISSDGEVVDANDGSVFYTNTKNVNYLEGKVTTENYEIFADDLFYNEIKKESTADGNVEVISNENDIIIYGDHAISDEVSGKTTVWGNTLLKQIVEGDTLYMTADTLISIDSEIDSISRLLAYKNVKLFKNDMQGVADSMAYMMADSMMFFYQDPVLWNEQNQLTSDTINVEIKNGSIDKLNMRNRAFSVNQDTVGNFNQIKGKHMTAFIQDNEMQKILVDGNGESLYFALDDKSFSLIGMNKIICSNMRINFAQGEVNDITFYKNPEGQFIPPHELQENQKTLKDFKWHADRKPSLMSVLGVHYARLRTLEQPANNDQQEGDGNQPDEVKLLKEGD